MQTYLEVFGRLPTMLTRRLILRPVRMSDAQDLYEYSRDPEVARHVLWDAHRSIHQTRPISATFCVSTAAARRARLSSPCATRAR